MTDSSAIDPITGRLEGLQAAMTTSVGHAEGANGRISIDCTADGMIRDWYVADVLRSGDIHAVVSVLVALQHEAVEKARETVREATEDLRTDPRFNHVINALGDAVNNPSAAGSGPARRPDNVEDSSEPTRPGIFVDPVGRPRNR